MTSIENAHLAVKWIGDHLLSGTVFVVQEITVDAGNVVRRSTEVTADVQLQLYCLCMEFGREASESLANIPRKASKEKTQGEPVAAQERPSGKASKAAAALKKPSKKGKQ